MITVQPVTLERDGIRLEPLNADHESALVSAASDGRLWELWFTTVPAPEAMSAYIATALAGQRDGHMLPWAVRDLESDTIIGSTRYHDIVSAIDRVEIGYTVVFEEPPADGRQHHLQAAPARPRLRHARLQGRRAADRQLQLPLAARHRGARREEGRGAAASRDAARRQRAGLGAVQHPGG